VQLPIGNDEDQFTIFIASMNNPLFIWGSPDIPSIHHIMTRD